MSAGLRRLRSQILVPLFLRFVLPALRALPLPSTIIGPVRRTLPSLAGFIESSRAGSATEARKDGHWVVRVADEMKQTNPPPVLALPGLPDNYQQIRMLRCPEIYLGQLHWGRVATHALEVVSPTDAVFEDLFHTLPSVRPTRSMIAPLLPRVERKPGTYATICIGNPSNYCHWIRDCLTRLWVLDACDATDFHLIVPKDSAPFQRQTLEMLGYGEDRLAPFGREHWQVEHLLVPSLTNRYRNACPAACQWLRKRFRDAIGRPKASKRLYVSRALAGKRRVSNEVELMPILETHGFSQVQAETLTAREQAETFAQAEIIVAPHGAGLANMIFMEEDTLVVELNRYSRMKSSFYSMASALGIRYACITDAPQNPEDENDRQTGDIDFSIPADRLSSALRTLGLR